MNGDHISSRDKVINSQLLGCFAEWMPVRVKNARYGNMSDLHEALAEVKGRTKFRSVRLGGLDKQDDPVPRVTKATALRVVENAA